MVRFSLILALAGVAFANTPIKGYKSQARSRSIGLRGVDTKLLAARDTCSTFEDVCDSYCMPSTGECCSSGNGAYCELGDYCVSGGCCPIGKICTGDATSCDTGEELCGNSCIPEGATCCSDGRYCDAGDLCTSDGRCDSSASESGGSHRTSIDSFPSATATGGDSIFDDDGDDEDNSTSTDDTGSSTLCKRKGGKSSSGGSSGSSGDDDEDGGDGGDGCDDADDASTGSILAPSVFALLFAAAVAML